MGSIRGGTARRKGPRDRMLGRYTRGIVSAAPIASVVTETQMPWELPIWSWVGWCVPQRRGASNSSPARMAKTVVAERLPLLEENALCIDFLNLEDIIASDWRSISSLRRSSVAGHLCDRA